MCKEPVTRYNFKIHSFRHDGPVGVLVESSDGELMKFDDMQSLLHDGVLGYIERLENDSFAGWSESSKNAYKTALTSVKEWIKRGGKVE
jgi:hypothetical protein